MSDTRSSVTRLLVAWSHGDPEALDRLVPLILEELRMIARQLLRGEDREISLQSTDLVHEVYLRLAGKRTVRWESSTHFFAEMANMIRRLLVDHARSRKRQKRGGGIRPEPLEEGLAVAREPAPEIEALAAALESLWRRNQRQSLVVHLRYFVGLSVEEIAHILEVHARTVKRDWNLAKLWLYQELARR